MYYSYSCWYHLKLPTDGSSGTVIELHKENKQKKNKTFWEFVKFNKKKIKLFAKKRKLLLKSNSTFRDWKKGEIKKGQAAKIIIVILCVFSHVLLMFFMFDKFYLKKYKAQLQLSLIFVLIRFILFISTKYNVNCKKNHWFWNHINICLRRNCYGQCFQCVQLLCIECIKKKIILKSFKYKHEYIYKNIQTIYGKKNPNLILNHRYLNLFGRKI